MNNPYEAPPSSAPNPSEGPFMFQNSVSQVAQQVEQMLVAEGYRLESGTTTDAVYGKGNNLLRMILGALIKRYRFKVTVNPTGTGALVDIQKAMTGMMGGAIGYSQMKKEHNRICELLNERSAV